MDDDIQLPTSVVQDDLMVTAKSNEENLRSSVVDLNKISSDYRSTLSLIDEKLILLSAGSVSLLLTFLGILFNSSRDTSSLKFAYVFIGIFCFLTVAGLLLAARRLWSLYLFSITHGHYLENLRSKLSTELQLIRSNSNIINQTTYSKMSAKEVKAMEAKILVKIKKVEAQLKQDKKMEKNQLKWAKILALGSYGLMIFAYLFIALFFIGVVDILNNKA